MGKAKQVKTKGAPIATNRKAWRNYNVLEKFEAGISLLGSEVKSLRAHNADLSSGFAAIENGEVILHDVHIYPYEYSHQLNHEPRRPRRLLLHKHEIKKLFSKVTLKGHTLIPLSLYFNRRGKIKVEIGLCQGKHFADKRDALRRKSIDRETARAIRSHR